MPLGKLDGLLSKRIWECSCSHQAIAAAGSNLHDGLNVWGGNFGNYEFVLFDSNSHYDANYCDD